MHLTSECTPTERHSDITCYAENLAATIIQTIGGWIVVLVGGGIAGIDDNIIGVFVSRCCSQMVVVSVALNFVVAFVVAA